MHSACLSNQFKLVTYILIEGGDVNYKNIHNQTPLHYACMKSPTHLNREIRDCNSIIYWLIENHANMNAIDENGDTPLHIALYNEFQEASYILLLKGANVSIQNNKGLTPLHIMCAKGYLSMIHMMKKIK